ncbi:MAG: HD domain-containing protein [Hyphomonas sp.]|nr:HD domain-containing protein [Hyphomonas sp.]MCB9962508.1 HD domain-containing protein [Hyphomonas sp.]MCB9972040.1 HD domain-containing protein [Hyphomonas sp.]
MADGHDLGQRAKFREMAEGTQEDWNIIGANSREFNKGLARRVLDHLRLLDGDFGGFPVDRLEHSLQTATRAHRDGRDEEYVVCALLHDIGDTLGSMNHADIAAAILKPFVSEENHWMIANHGIFQGYYFFEYLGLDRNMRDRFKDSPHFQRCAEFCHKYDQAAFDPDYESEPLEFFEPMVERVFARPKNSIYMREQE